MSRQLHQRNSTLAEQGRPQQSAVQHQATSPCKPVSAQHPQHLYLTTDRFVPAPFQHYHCILHLVLLHILPRQPPTPLPAVPNSPTRVLAKGAAPVKPNSLRLQYWKVSFQKRHLAVVAAPSAVPLSTGPPQYCPAAGQSVLQAVLCCSCRRPLPKHSHEQSKSCMQRLVR